MLKTSRQLENARSALERNGQVYKTVAARFRKIKKGYGASLIKFCLLWWEVKVGTIVQDVGVRYQVKCVGNDATPWSDPVTTQPVLVVDRFPLGRYGRLFLYSWDHIDEEVAARVAHRVAVRKEERRQDDAENA